MANENNANTATCRTCPFYFMLANECRVNPPHGMPVPGPGGDVRVMSFWPPSRPEQWCGKHPDRQPRNVIVSN